MLIFSRPVALIGTPLSLPSSPSLHLIHWGKVSGFRFSSLVFQNVASKHIWWQNQQNPAQPSRLGCVYLPAWVSSTQHFVQHTRQAPHPLCNILPLSGRKPNPSHHIANLPSFLLFLQLHFPAITRPGQARCADWHPGSLLVQPRPATPLINIRPASSSSSSSSHRHSHIYLFILT